MNNPKIKVIDNFLKPDEFKNLQDVIVDGDFPWFFKNGVNKIYSERKGFLGEEYDFQFTHVFYYKSVPYSKYYECLFPLFEKLNIFTLIRAKANLTVRTSKIIEHGYHIDNTTNQKYNVAVFYLNDNDGYTKFRDGTKIDSIANRIVIFDSDLEHCGSTCTDQNARIVINLNYFEV